LGPANRLFSADYPGAMAALVELHRPGSHVLFTNGAAGNIHPRWCKRTDTWALEHLGTLLAKKVLKATEEATQMHVSSLALQTTSLWFPSRADPSTQVEAEVACLRAGPLAIGFLPGEPFVELQLALRRARRARWTPLVGYANGWVGYIPDREAAAHGGFGVDFCHHDPRQYTRTMLPLGAAEQLLEALVELAG
jgi:neutral ceramidase